MKVSSLLKGSIYEVSFRCNPKMEGYTTLMSDIPELSEIASPRKKIFKFKITFICYKKGGN